MNYTIIGCPESTDLDLIIVCSSFEHKVDIDSLQIKTNKKLDINKIIIEKGNIIQVEKGTIKDTHAIIYYTQHLHDNKYLIQLNQPDNIVYEERKIQCIKFIFDKLEQLTDKETYKKLRPIKIQIYNQSYENKLDFIQDIFRIWKEKQYNANDTYKTLMIKVVQLILLFYKTELCSDFFTKQGMISLFQRIYHEDDELIETLKYYLYRGKSGSVKGLSKLLNELFWILKS
jgi:hypothetical protein